MIELTTRDEMHAATPLFAELASRHLSVAAVLTGTIAGGIWVDQPRWPRVGLAFTPEGSYLAGDPHAEHTFPALRDLIPTPAYLIAEPTGWADVLDQVWNNRFARAHARRTYRLRTLRMADWRDRLPDGYAVIQVDRDFLAQTDLHGYADIADRADAWPSMAAFVAQNFGVCIVRDGAIASHAIADCVVDDRCEIGVGTHPAHRRRGLGSIAAAAAVERALTAGIKDVGWHCLRSNRGSMAVAERVGFTLAADYVAYSLSLPAQNAGDLSTAECIDWAEHCERASTEIGWSAFFAAGAWAQAGDPLRALANIQRLIDTGWPGQPEWLETNWMFDGLRETPAFTTQIAALRAQQSRRSTL